jgi:hypothetical protein
VAQQVGWQLPLPLKLSHQRLPTQLAALAGWPLVALAAASAPGY